MRTTTTVKISEPILQDPERLSQALEKVVAEQAFEIERDIKEQIRAPKSGRTYRRGPITKRASKATRGLGLREYTTKRGFTRAIVGYKFHRASAPGEAPAEDSGAAIGSILTKPTGKSATITGSEIMRLLEEGTGRIAARPVFAPALERARPGFVREVDETVRRLSNG